MAGWGKRLFGVGAAAAIGVIGPVAPQARAECLDAVVYVTRQGEDPVYLHGESDPCVTQTPWDHTFTHHGEFTDTGMPNGAPNGYWVDLRVPAP